MAFSDGHNTGSTSYLILLSHVIVYIGIPISLQCIITLWLDIWIAIYLLSECCLISFAKGCKRKIKAYSGNTQKTFLIYWVYHMQAFSYIWYYLWWNIILAEYCHSVLNSFLLKIENGIFLLINSICSWFDLQRMDQMTYI